ncbi:MAG TPA: GAF domain-containing protein [Actinomycetota bacterium]
MLDLEPGDRRAAQEDDELRSVAQLRFLHGLAPRLNALGDVEAIAGAITDELRTLIDYHNCRIYLLQNDGVTLWPIVFRGSLSEYEGETLDELVTVVGEGITGRAVESGSTYYAPDALNDPTAVQIPGTSEIDESVLAVPLSIGDRVTGVIVLSSLGIDQFDQEDVRVLEVLASHAAVAFENARLLQQEREAARTASALLGLSQALTGTRDVVTVLERVTAAVPSLVEAEAVVAYLRDPQTGGYRLATHRGLPDGVLRNVERVDPKMAAALLNSVSHPFQLVPEDLAWVPRGYLFFDEPRAWLIVPLRWETDELAVVIAVAHDAEARYTDRDLTLARGIGDIASLALGSARRFHELERFHELVDSLDAIFWEAEPHSLRFTFRSRKAYTTLLDGGDADAPPPAWGDHVHPEDRSQAVRALRESIATPGHQLSLEYRAAGRNGDPMWLRDLVHVTTSPQGEPVVRGLIVDITARKKAEEALRRSEQKYAEAFRREREAAHRLRTLDEMKNTFLQAVSHDLRTPLTSILGSAVTLEHAGFEIPREDAIDLLHRIAANARKLERLLSDLLDLDRLQRGIVSPQRRRIDVAELVTRVVRESDMLNGRQIELETDRVVVNVDPAKVERIVENLVANAGRHTPPEAPLWIRVCGQDGGVLLAVEDAGPGVADDLKEAIFEPFRSAELAPSPSPGVGIGLSLVARFAELHGGRAWVEDRPGGGSSFRVFLPDAA